MLTVKFEKGLFDHPFTDEARCKTAFLQADALALAREAAAKSCVLLKNENGRLPLSRRKKIALIGPLAEDPMNWLAAGPPAVRRTTSFLSPLASARTPAGRRTRRRARLRHDGTAKLKNGWIGTTVHAGRSYTGEDAVAKHATANSPIW